MMHALKTLSVSLLLVSIAAGSSPGADEPVTASFGEWTATLGPQGLGLTHGQDVISLGSYLTVFRPEYEGNVLTSRAAWNEGQAEVSDDGRTLSLSAELEGGSYRYEARLSEDGVRIVLRIVPSADAQIGPVEYSIAQIPEMIVAGATIEVLNVAGIVSASLPLPEVAQQGGITGAGPVLVFNTPARTITIESLDFGTVYPLDARHERYGARHGIWPFASPAMRAGQETVAAYELRIAPPAPVREPGTITLAPASEATVILTPPEATHRETLAAEELARYLEAITGLRLEIAQYRGGPLAEGAIAIGTVATEAGLIAQEELDALAAGGYVVRAQGGRVAVCGPRDVGAIYGVYALLRQLGCKFYAPDCEVVPQTPRLIIPEVTLAASPFYEFRNLSANLKLGHTPRDDIMNPREIGGEGSIVHVAAYLVPYDEYYEEHPEYFALQADGRRLPRDPDARRFDVHLCMSNPDVRRIASERLLEIMELQHDRRFFGVTPGDGSAYCHCEPCRALDAVPFEHQTDRNMDFVNHLAREAAKQHPDKRILTLAYHLYLSRPPTRVMPEPNVMVMYCPYPTGGTRCQSHDLTCEHNEQGLEDVLAWTELCPDNVYIFDYPTGYQNWYEPFGSFWAMKRKMDLYASRGVTGLYYCGTPRNFQDLFIYVQSHLLWDPGAPVEQLIGEFMDAYYGAAAPYVREYFDYMHREFDERPVHQMCEGASPHTVTPEWAERGLELLGRAEEAVRDDRARLYRVRAEKMCVLFGDLNARNPSNGELVVDEEEFARRLGEFCDIGRTRRITQFIRRMETDEWLYRVARIRPEHSPWYTDPLIDQLIANPVETLAAQQRRQSTARLDTATLVEMGGVAGWRLELEGFRGARGPEVYQYECPPRLAVWIYGTNMPNSEMWTILALDQVPRGQARLVLEAQDDDKPGAVRLRITVNDAVVFEGENPFVERGWSTEEFVIPPGVLRDGENEIRVATLDESTARDQGWFMVADCYVLVDGQ